MSCSRAANLLEVGKVMTWSIDWKITFFWLIECFYLDLGDGNLDRTGELVLFNDCLALPTYHFGFVSGNVLKPLGGSVVEVTKILSET